MNLNLSDPIGSLREKFIYELSLVSYKYDYPLNGKDIVTKLDDYIKEESYYNYFLLQRIQIEYPDGCLILGTGEFGRIFKQYLHTANYGGKYDMLVLDISNYSDKTCPSYPYTLDELPKETSSKGIIFIDDSYSTGTTFSQTTDFLSGVGRKFSSGFVFNFTGYQSANISKPL